MVRWTLKKGSIANLSLATVLSLLLSCSQDSAFAKKHNSSSGAASNAANSEQSAGNNSTLPSLPAPNDSAPPVVQKLEQHLFFKTYPEDNLASRLERIEKQIFGESLSREASDTDRLAKLEQVLKQQEEEDHKRQEAESLRNTLQNGQRATGSYGSVPNYKGSASRSEAAGNNLVPRQGATGSSPDSSNDENSDDLERARSSIQTARDEEISGLLASGVKLYRSKRGMEAQEKFEQALRLDPHNAEANFNLGIVEESMGNYIEAYTNYKQAAESEPENKEYHDAVVAVERKADQQQRSNGKRTELRQLAEEANAAWKRGEYISALDLYKQLDAKEPNKALVKYNIGSIYLMLKDQPSALEYYRLASRLDPNQSKYKNAYKELAASLETTQKERQQIDKETLANYNNANGLSNSKSGHNSKKNKTNKHNSNSTTNQPGSNHGSSQLTGSPFAPYAIVGGGTPVIGGSLPGGTISMNGNMSGMNSGMAKSINNSAPTRSSFGVNRKLVNNFTQQSPGKTMNAQNATPQLSIMNSYGLSGRANGQGVTITNVGIASRAAAAGLMPGDDIRAVDGIQISQPDEINNILGQKNASERIPMLILRNGNMIVLTL